MLNSELAKKEPTQNGCPLSGTQTGNKKETIISLKNHINGTTAIDTLHKKVMEVRQISFTAFKLLRLAVFRPFHKMCSKTKTGY